MGVSFVRAVWPLAFACCLFTSCRSDSNGESDEGLADEATSYEGLAFTTTDLEFQASKLHYMDLATGKLETLVSGESGDPWLAWLGDRLYLFNRSGATLNYRSGDPRAEDKSLTAQTALPEAGPGDPHAALALPSGDFLLAYQSTGILVVLDPATNTVKQKLEGFDVGGGEKSRFRPAGLWRDDETGRIFVLHLGVDADYALDGSEAVFVIEQKDDGLEILDMDGDEPGLQGLPLPMSRPAFVVAGDGALRIAGLCFGFDLNCKAAVASLDPKTPAVTDTVDLGPMGLKANGTFVAGSDAETLYASVLDGEAPVLKKVSIATKTVETVHAYEKGSNGCCALYFDRTSGRLYVGDRTEAGTGLLHVYDKGSAEPMTLELEGIPYTHVFVP